jgi:hypothetical protein
MLSVAAAAEVAGIARHWDITGRLAGRYDATRDNRPADVPLRVSVGGSGRVQGLGMVRLSGSMAFGGFLAPGVENVNGTVTLSNARGSVTLRVHGFGGNDQIPGGRFNLSVAVQSGIGAFARVHALGSADFQFGGKPSAGGSSSGPLKIDLGLRRPLS